MLPMVEEPGGGHENRRAVGEKKKGETLEKSEGSVVELGAVACISTID